MHENTTKGLSAALALLLVASALFGAVGTVAADTAGAWDTETSVSSSTTDIGNSSPYSVSVNESSTGDIRMQTDAYGGDPADLEVRIKVTAKGEYATVATLNPNWETISSSDGQYRSNITHEQIRSELPHTVSSQFYEVVLVNTADGTQVASGGLAVTFSDGVDTVRIDAASKTLDGGYAVPTEIDAQNKSFSGVSGTLIDALGANTFEGIPVIGSALADVEQETTVRGATMIDKGNTSTVEIELGDDAAQALKASADTTSEGERMPLMVVADDQRLPVYDSKAPSGEDGAYAVANVDNGTVTIHTGDSDSGLHDDDTLPYEVVVGQDFADDRVPETPGDSGILGFGWF